MGVKSTRDLTRAQAEAKYVDVHVEAQRQKRRGKLEERMAGVEVYDLSMPYKVRENLPDLTSSDVREIAIAVDLAGRASTMRQKAMVALAELQDDTRLENELQRMNDLVSGGEGFESYSITANPNDRY